MPLPLKGCGPSPDAWFLGSTRVHNSNVISIGLPVFIQGSRGCDKQTDRQTDPSLHRQQEVVHATRSNTQFMPPDPTQQGSFFSRRVGRRELATREGNSEEALLLTSSRNAAVYRPLRRQAERSGPLRAGCRRCTSPPPSVPAAAPCQRRHCRHRKRKRKSSRDKGIQRWRT